MQLKVIGEKRRLQGDSPAGSRGYYPGNGQIAKTKHQSQCCPEPVPWVTQAAASSEMEHLRQAQIFKLDPTEGQLLINCRQTLS